ncbi:hypothetical protein [Solirubrobacter soli]|uniref:hypothetical protein n=1 Tax=Solirubrobacter soli TaxID=363832 RepID=UPI0003FDFF70|nr:hypothetical protein [Solirubrobacter soli]
MTIAGLTLPFVSAPDPDVSGEGSLDPLGLARIADRLADEIAPEVTARMSRIRFVTAIAACSALVERPIELVGADGTPAYLAFEWLVVEAFVRRRPDGALDGVPGSQKARRQLRSPNAHLDAGSYLQIPKVFGFHGVYKRLARDMQVVDEVLGLLPRGEGLLRVWERETGLGGFLMGRQRLARRLLDEVRAALDGGRVRASPRAHLWGDVSRVFAPSGAGPRERALLWKLLTDPVHPMRRELAELVRRHGRPEHTEREEIEQFLTLDVSPELATRLAAIGAYEALVRELDDGLQILRVLASALMPAPVRPSRAAAHPGLARAAGSVASAVAAASAALAPLGLEVDVEDALGSFRDVRSPEAFVEALLDRHDGVQRDKGKRSWFERDERGFAVRPAAQRHDPIAPRTEYLHPYRIYSLRSFASDLHPAS